LLLALLPGQLVWLWLLRGPLILEREAVLVWGQVVLGLCVIGVWGLLRTTPADAIRLPARTGVFVVLGGTILLQAAAVALLVPALSDDLFRYRVDGRMWLAGASPYATPPAAFHARVAPDPVDAMVPFADWRTIYPPVSQAVFAATRALDNAVNARPTPGSEPQAATQTSSDVPTASRPLGAWRASIVKPGVRERTVVFRIAFAALAVIGVGVLILALRRTNQSVWWAALLGFNPVLTLEVGGMGHQDAIGLLFIALAVWAVVARRMSLAAGMLALATGVKPFAALLLPFLWRQAHEEFSFHAGRRAVGVFAVTIAVTFGPALFYQNGQAGWRASAAHFGRTWEGNAFLYESFKAWVGPGDEGRQMVRAKDAARLLSMLAVLGAGLLLWQTRARLPEAGYWLFMTLLLSAPVAYPWYLIWVLAFVPLLRAPGAAGAAALVWSATAAMAYTVWRNVPASWTVPQGWLTAEYLPVLVTLAVEAILLARRAPLRRLAIVT
jgi:hypothetical protein